MLENLMSWVFPGDSVVKNPPANTGGWVRSLVQEDPTRQLSLCATTAEALTP